MRFENLAIETVTYELPPRWVTSTELEDRLLSAMQRLKLPTRPIQLLTGIARRRFWEPGTKIHDVATRVARRAIYSAGITPDQVGILINTSVCKDYIEPSMASLVHGDLGLPASCRNFDVANACLGFLDGIQIAGQMIESGLVDYALIVDGESSEDIVESTIRRLLRLDITAKEFWENFATLTLGSVAVAMVLTHARLSRTTHRVNGSVTLADTSQNRLCLGTTERMVTESTRLLKAGVSLAQRTWEVAQKANKWQGRNITRFRNDEYDRAYRAAEGEVDPVKRAALFIRMNDIVIQNVVVIPVLWRNGVSGAANALHGMDLTGWDSTFWRLPYWYKQA